MPLPLRRLLLLSLLSAPLAGCAGEALQPSVENPALQPGEEASLLYVGPRWIPCSGEGITRCLQVRRAPEGAWEAFYDSIQGFGYQEGYSYTLAVATREVANPPADASSRSIRLLRVIARSPGS
jgi:hypothetical protein